MRNSIYRITLDMHDVASQVQITAKQHDTARKLHITLSENGSPYTIEEGCRAVLSINRSGSTVIIDDCEIKLNGSVIMYDFNSQTTEVLGINECEVKLYDPDGDIITSPRFTLLVDENVYNDGEDHGIDHRNVLNRDKEDQHPIKAITGLEKELESKANAEKIYAEIALDRSRIDNIAALGQNSVIEVQKKYNTTGATTPLTFTLGNDGKCVVIIYYYKSAPNTETYSSSVLVNSQSIFTKTLDGAAGTYLEEVEFDGKAGDIVTITRDNVNVSINSVLYVTNKSTDTELADIRLGADGTIYPCAGDAVREQVSALKNDVDSQVGALKGDLSKYCEVEKTVQTADFYTGRYGDEGYYVLSNGWANISNPSKVFLTKGTVLKAVKPAFVKAYILKQYNADGTFTQLGGGFTEKEITEDGTYTVCVYTTYTTRQLTSEELVEIANGFSIELTYTKLRNDIDANANVIAEIQDDIDPRNRSGELASAEIHVDDFTVSGQTDSQIIKNCLRFAQSFKHRTIVFDRRDFHISESIMIPSDTTIIIDGVTVKQNDGVFDTMFRSDNMTMDANYPHGLAIDMTQCANIRIIGKNGAKISGCDNVNTSIITNPDKDWGTWGWKGILILITNCNNIEVAGLSLEKPHMWAVSFELCTNGYIHDLNFNTTEINMDGVDLRYGCKHFMIDTITGKTFDDSVALTCSAVRNRQNSDYPLGPNAVYPAQITQGLISDMTDDELAIEDVQVKNVLTGGSCRSAICYTNYGGIVRNCVFDTLEDAEDIDNRVAIFKAYGGNEYMAKSISNIRVNNIKSNNVYRPVQILCDVDDVWINKIRKSSWMANEITDSDGVTVTNLSNI